MATLKLIRYVSKSKSGKTSCYSKVVIAETGEIITGVQEVVMKMTVSPHILTITTMDFSITEEEVID